MKATEIAVAMEAVDNKTIRPYKKQKEMKINYEHTKERNKTMEKWWGHQQKHVIIVKGKNIHHKNCRFREAQCHNCGKKGHIVVACQNRTRQQYT